jgi:hypothetical protein
VTTPEPPPLFARHRPPPVADRLIEYIECRALVELIAEADEPIPPAWLQAKARRIVTQPRLYEHYNWLDLAALWWEQHPRLRQVPVVAGYTVLWVLIFLSVTTLWAMIP